MSTTAEPTAPFTGSVDVTPQNCWLAARHNLTLAETRGVTGGRLLHFESLEFQAWVGWLEVAIREEIPGAVLKDWPDDDIDFLHEGDMTPPEAAAWMAAEPPF